MVKFLALLAVFGVLIFLSVAFFFSFHPNAKIELFPKPTPHAAVGFDIGFNSRGIIHYGYPELLTVSKNSDRTAALTEMQRMGATVVRVFVANNLISDQEAANRLRLFLIEAKKHNISVIPVMIDYYHSRFNPQGTDQYYTDDFQGIKLLNRSFFESGYQSRYKSFVQTVINTNKQEPNIFAWEVGNELKYDVDTSIFVNFMKDMTNYMHTLDPGHRIATGMIATHHTNLTPEALYPQLPNVNVITVHTYEADHRGIADLNWGLQNGKQVIIEEVGFGQAGNRTQRYRDETNFWKANGASVVMPWGFLPNGISDNGDGDSTFGMDAIWHTDYAGLFNLFSEYGNFSCLVCDNHYWRLSGSACAQNAPVCEPNNPNTYNSCVGRGEATGVICETIPTPTPTVCLVCDSGKWRTAGSCPANPPLCQVNNPATFGGCLPNGQQSGGVCEFTPTAPPTPTPIPTIAPTTPPTAVPTPTRTPNPTSAPTVFFIPGDADKNGRVDIFDYNIVLRDYGKIGVIQGDVDKDNDCDIFDYNIVLRDYGKSM